MRNTGWLYRLLGEVVLWAAFLASGGHIFKVAEAMGNPWPIAAVHAVGLDGLVYVGINAVRCGSRAWGIAAVLYGGGMSLAFNAAAYSEDGTLPSWLIAASMPVSLILSVIVSHAVVRKPVAPAEPMTRKRIARPAPVLTQDTPEIPQDTTVVPAAEPDVRPVSALVPPNDRVAKAMAMLADGRDKEDVAATVGCTVRTLNRWIATSKETTTS